jgi:periplasmic divalent cation tolerance protein
VKIVLSTVSLESAKNLALAIVHARVAACVNVVPTVTSVYRWRGVVEQNEEALLVIKTSDAQLVALTEFLSREHPYELPEIVALDPSFTQLAYAAWVDSETGFGAVE